MINFKKKSKIVTKFWLKPVKFLQNIYMLTISFDKFPIPWFANLLKLSPCAQ